MSTVNYELHSSAVYGNGSILVKTSSDVLAVRYGSS